MSNTNSTDPVQLRELVTAFDLMDLSAQLPGGNLQQGRLLKLQLTNLQTEERYRAELFVPGPLFAQLAAMCQQAAKEDEVYRLAESKPPTGRSQ